MLSIGCSCGIPLRATGGPGPPQRQRHAGSAQLHHCAAAGVRAPHAGLLRSRPGRLPGWVLHHPNPGCATSIMLPQLLHCRFQAILIQNRLIVPCTPAIADFGDIRRQLQVSCIHRVSFSTVPAV